MALSALVILVSIADIGFLYYYKREYQKAADLAAMAGARTMVGSGGAPSCDAVVRPAAESNAAQNLGSLRYILESGDDRFRCGQWNPTASTALLRVDNTADPSLWNAVFVTVSGSPPRFLPFVDGITLSATATAVASEALASLRIRSTLVSIDTSRSAALNSLFGGLLGGNVALDVGSWNGLVNADISLLDYLDQLALDLGIQAGHYDQVLATQASLGELMDAAITLLQRGQGTGSISAALAGMQTLQAAIPGATPLIALGDIVSVGSGAQTAGLDAALQVFQLAQALVQAANAKNALAATVNLGALTVRVQVIEPPQISAIGNPELARQDPDGPHRIYVNTAQVRTLISVNLPALSGVTNLLNSVLNLAAPVTTLLNNVLSLNLQATLAGLVGSLLGIPYEVTDVMLVPGNPRIDVSLDAGGGEAKVTDYACEADGEKRLETDVETSVADLRIGRMQITPGQPGYVFGSDAPPSVGPVPLVDVGVKTCRVFLLLLSSCEARRPFEGGGIGIMAQTTVAGTPYSHVYLDPPDLGLTPEYAAFSTQNIVSSLANTLGGIELQMYGPAAGGGLGGLLNLVGAAFNTVKGLLQPVIDSVLSPLLDPLVNTLLSSLGLDLARVEVGGNLTCGGGGATLIN